MIINVEAPPARILIGRESENNWTLVTAECAAWLEKCPSGLISALLLPEGASDPYPVTLTESGTQRTWLPQSEELIKGTGKLQYFLQSVDGSIIGSSAIIRCEVGESLTSPTEHPESAAPSWALQVVADAEAAAERAEAAAESVSPEAIAQAIEDYLDEHPGTDGYSPTATVTKDGSVVTITITDKNGTTTATVSDGTNGANGTNGADGTTYTPAVSSAGVISWTNDGDKANPASVDLVSAVIAALTPEVTVATDGAVTQELEAQKVYHFTGDLTSLTITLAAATGHYHFDFVSGATAPTLTLPASVTMPDSFEVEAGRRYEADILNGYSVVQSWEVSA